MGKNKLKNKQSVNSSVVGFFLVIFLRKSGSAENDSTNAGIMRPLKNKKI